MSLLEEFEQLDTSDALEHFGVKGMKWGVRQDAGHVGEQVKLKKLGKLDKKWEKAHSGVKGFIKVNNALADRLNGPNGGFAKLNKKYEHEDFSDSKLKDPEVRKRYDGYLGEVARVQNEAMRSVAADLGFNPSGTKRFNAVYNEEGGYVDLVLQEVQHADEYDFHQIGRLNDKGLVVSVEPADKTLAQAEDLDYFLEHYGVKGMKWGQTKSEFGGNPGVSGHGGPAKPHTRKNPEPHSEDATRVGNINSRVKVQKTTKQLSNKELETAIKRMQLEQQYSKLSGGLEKTRRQKAAAFIGELLLGTAKDVAVQQSKGFANAQVKDKIDEKMKQGKYTPKPAADA